ncbi:RNA-binding protein MEX3B [Chlorella vulgaris]
MSRCLTAALCVLLSVCCALGLAGKVEAKPLSIFSDSTAWDFLDGADWQALVEQRARLLACSESSGSSAEPSSCVWCRKELKVWLQRSDGGLAAAVFPCQHRCVCTPLQCQLKTLSAVTAFLSAQHGGEGRRLWQRLRPTFALGFRRIVQHLARGRSFAALRESVALADKLGWAWQGTHLTEWGHGHAQCWDQVAVLRVMMNDKAEGSLARELNFGSLEDEWQGHLNDFFNHSKEHALPWTVEGNLEPLTTTLDDDANATPLSNTVQWALPRLWFEISEYLSSPDEPMWQHAEARAFIAAGYAWYPTLRAQHKDASFGVRLWVPPQGSPRDECMVWLDDPIHFNVTVTVANAWTGASNWTANWICSWPASFDNLLTCAALGTMPLWGMLTEDLPGFIQDDELLLTVTVQLLPPDCGASRAASETDTALDEREEEEEEEGGQELEMNRDEEEEQACLARLATGVGPLKHVGGMLASPILRWGFLRGDPGLRGLHGFESRRLPGSGALNVGRHLAAVAAQRLASTPWVDAALYSDARAEAVLTAAEAAWLAPGGSGYTGDRGGMCGVQGAASEGSAEPFCEGDGVGLEIVWDDGSPEPGSHLANALAALALVAVPPAVWQAVLAYRRRQERLRSARRSQQSRRHHPNTQPHRQRAGSGIKTPTKPKHNAARDQPASGSPPLAASKRGQTEVDMHSATTAGTAQVEVVSGPLDLAEESATPCAAVFDKPPAEQEMQAAPAPPAALAPATCASASALQVNPSTSALQGTPSTTRTGAAGSRTEPAGHELGVPSTLQQPADPLPSAADVLAAMLPFEVAGVLPSQQQQPENELPSQQQHQQPGGALPPQQQQQQQQQASLGAADAGTELAAATTWEEPPASTLQPEAMQEGGDAGGSQPPGSRSAPGTPAASKAPYAAVTPLPAAPIWPYSPPMHSAAATGAAAKQAVRAAALAAPAAAPLAGGAATGESSECIVCWEAERAVVLVPCGHLGLCRSCADDLLSEAEPLCPLCRAEVLFAQAFYSA